MSGNGGGAAAAILYNCIVTGNQALWGGGTWRCGVVGSFLTRNFGDMDAGGDFASGMVDCTIVGNWGYNGVAGVRGSSLKNCIVYFNIRLSDYSTWEGADATYNYCCTTPMPTSGVGNITNTPIFQADGFHLAADSPCRGAGALAYSMGVDIDGRPWLNPPSIGCDEFDTNVAPTLALEADYTNVLAGNPLALQAVVSGGSDAYLLWDFGDSSAPGLGLATAHAWTTPGDYTVLVTAFFSGMPVTATSSIVIHVAGSDAPTILTQPADQTVTEGGAAQFCVVAGGSPVLAYQWRYNGTNLPGATNASLRLTYLQINQAGLYSVVVFDPRFYPPGQITSSNAVLTVTLPVCLPPPPGLTTWWRAEGDFTDVVAGNNGTNQNVSFANGKVGQAFVFAAGASALSVPASPTLEIGSGGLSIEAWIQPDAVALSGLGAPIIEWNAGATNLVRFWAGSTLLAGFVDAQGMAHTLRSAPGCLDTNHWQHVAFSYDLASGDAAIYVNGEVAGTTNFGTVPPQTAGAVNLGGSAATTNFFSGLLDEVSLYNRALSPAEILALFNAEQAGKCNVPVAPTVVAPPRDTSVLPGADAGFAVVAAGTAPLSYQWLRNGNPLPGATNASLILSNAACAENGSLYSVSVSNAGGSVVSSNAPLTIINTPPQISSISNQVVSYSAPFVTVPFQVSNGGLPATSVAMSGASANTNLVSNGQIVFGGTDTNRTVTLTANSNSFGSATVALVATGPCGATNQRSFNLLVTNFPPLISTITNQRGPFNAVLGPVAFTVTDAETSADQLLVTASTSNNSVVPTNQIVLAGTGANRTVTILPGTNISGSATITLVVTDTLGATKSTSFSVALEQFTQIAPGLPAWRYENAVAWGDADGDGKLDLLVSGTTNNAANGALTRVYHNDGGMFTNFLSLPGMYRPAVAWGDFDRDGRLDFAISGLSSSDVPLTRIYHNNPNGTFTDLNAGLTGCYSGTLAWGDFDNDGVPDLFVSGLVITAVSGSSWTTTNMAKIYRNNGNGTFTDLKVNLLTAANRVAGPNNGTAAWGDYDNDGKLDLLLVGSINNTIGMASVFRNLGDGTFTNAFNDGNGSTYSYGGAGAWADYDNDGWLDFEVSSSVFGSTSVFHNNRDGSFTRIAGLSGGSWPSGTWGDYDNDGYLDVIAGGNRLYRNNRNGTFTDSKAVLPGSYAVAWGDFNNDGNLDLILAADGMTAVYRNNNPMTNVPPAAPTSLVAMPGLSNSVVFTWSPPVDSQTASNGLKYNLRVGTAPGGVDVVSPLADPVTGQRRVVALGNSGPTNRAWLNNLPRGTYYWSVQAIDTAFAGSPFGSEGTFAITNARPTLSPIADQTVAPLTTTAPIPFTIQDEETPASNLVFTVRSSNTNVVPLANVLLSQPSGDAPTNWVLRLMPRTNGSSLLTLTVTDEQGAFASAYFAVTADLFSLVTTNLLPVQHSFLAWGDFNNDGRLDVLISGHTNGNAALAPLAQLYRNDGNGVFTPVATGLPGLAYGSAAWGDFNNDGFLDLALSGSTLGTSGPGLARIHRNNGDGTFTDIGAGLPDVYSSALAWGDYDNDGRLDLGLSGQTSNGPITQIFRNRGDGSFSNAVSLPGFYSGAVAWADLDGDADLDLVVAGLNTNGTPPLTWIYRNNGEGSFTQVASLPGIYAGTVAVADYDGDGQPDLLLTGANGSPAYLTRIYRNAGSFTFSEIAAGLTGVGQASAAWGDFDNDGRPDILLSGTSNGGRTGAFPRVYRNTGLSGALTFSNYPTALPTNYAGAVAWADFDNNGTLDVLVSGTDGVVVSSSTRSQTMLFRNNSGGPNTPPTAPGGLAFARSNGVVSLTWTKSADAQTTNANGLQYQLRVGTAPGGVQVISPPADLATGFRRVAQTGVTVTNQWRSSNLPPGTYYWSVQAIDPAFAGSPFAAESSFVVVPPPSATPDSIATPVNTPATFATATLTLNDVSPGGLPLMVIAVSTNSARNGTVSLAAGMLTYTPPTNFSGNDSFAYTISDGQSAAASGPVIATVGSGGPISLKVVHGPALDNGNFVVRYAGIPGWSYTIEAASDLGGSWTKVTNLTAPSSDQGFGSGVFEFQRPILANASEFYRTVYPAY